MDLKNPLIGLIFFPPPICIMIHNRVDFSEKLEGSKRRGLVGIVSIACVGYKKSTRKLKKKNSLSIACAKPGKLYDL